jgi:AraC family transcriptional regulator
MLFHQFPDLQWLKTQVEHNFANKKDWGGRSLPVIGWPTVILNVKTQNTYRDNIRGPLTIFTNLRGSSLVEADKRKVKINEDFFYVTNQDQRYTLEVDREKTETFNIHFGEFFSEQVLASKRRPEILLEEDPFITPIGRLNFHNKLHVKSEKFNVLVQEIQRADDDSMLIEEKLYELVDLLFDDERMLKNASQQLPVIKNSTRHEILKRLLTSTDYVYSYYDSDISLAQLASVSCLSKFHFLRLFKLVFNKTPHQFITEVRIEKAKCLLKKSKIDVKIIARSLGFKDPSSFSRVFYQQVGVYPTQFR